MLCSMLTSFQPEANQLLLDTIMKRRGIFLHYSEPQKNGLKVETSVDKIEAAGHVYVKSKKIVWMIKHTIKSRRYIDKKSKNIPLN